MRITKIKDGLPIPNNFGSLAEVKFDNLSEPLNNLIDNPSEKYQIPICEDALDMSFFADVLYRDLLNEQELGRKNDIVEVFFKLKRTGENSFVLLSNEKEILIFDNNIPGNEGYNEILGVSDMALEIGKLFYECIHRTQIFLEIFVKRIIEENKFDYNKEVVDFLYDYYNELKQDYNKNKRSKKYKKYRSRNFNDVHKFANIIEKAKKENEIEEQNLSWEIRYLIGVLEGQDTPRKWKEEKDKFDKDNKDKKKSFSTLDYCEKKPWIKYVICWGGPLDDVNVEFSNIMEFINSQKVHYSNLNNLYGNDTLYDVIKEKCDEIKNYRNITSHNIRNQVNQDSGSMSNAIDGMETLLERLNEVIDNPFDISGLKQRLELNKTSIQNYCNKLREHKRSRNIE